MHEFLVYRRRLAGGIVSGCSLRFVKTTKGCQYGEKGPELGGPGSAEKNVPLKSHPARSFSPRPVRKTGKSIGLEPSGLLLPGRAPQGCLGVRSLGNGLADPKGTDDSWPLRRRHGRTIVALSLFLDGLDHGQPHPQDLRPQCRRRSLLQLVRRGNHGQRPQPPTSAAGARRFLQDKGRFHRGQDPRPATHSVNIVCSGSSVLALHRVTI